MKRRTKVISCTLIATIAAATIAAVVVQSRVSAQAGPKIILYWEEDYQGRSLEVTSSLADLPVVADLFGNKFDWNDEIRSIVVVSGTWRAYQHGRHSTRLDETPLEVLDVGTKQKRAGWSTLLSATSQGPLRLPNAAVGGFFHDISSIELVSEENLPDWAAPSRAR